jgi:alpha-tubulin suppressor-like RCC1 family protein
MKTTMKKITILLLILLTSTLSHAQCWRSVSVGYQHVIAIADNGTLWAWGMNHFGELGDGTFNNFKNTPQQIGTDTDWKILSAGSGPVTFNLAIKNDGSLWSWGNNIYGQLGDGTFTNHYAPARVGNETNWSSISAGYSHALAIKTDGTLWSWGDSAFYALGYGNGYGDSYHKNVPTQIGTLNTWKSVSAGDKYSLALKTDNTVWGCGYNSGNPIGLNGGLYIQTLTPRAYNNTYTRAISAGGNHSFDVKISNLLVTWGSSTYGQTGGTSCAGCASYYPKEVDCGDDTSAIIKQDNTLWFVGKKLGAPSLQYTGAFTQLGTDSNWKSVSVGFQSGAAIKSDGSMYTWGWNFYGELGIGTNGGATDSMTLVPVPCPAVLATKNSVDKNFMVYPNPVQKILTVSSNSNTKTDRILILDLTGKVLIDDARPTEQVDVSNLAQGVYILKVFCGTAIENYRFIKK